MVSKEKPKKSSKSSSNAEANKAKADRKDSKKPTKSGKAKEREKDSKKSGWSFFKSKSHDMHDKSSTPSRQTPKDDKLEKRAKNKSEKPALPSGSLHESKKKEIHQKQSHRGSKKPKPSKAKPPASKGRVGSEEKTKIANTTGTGKEKTKRKDKADSPHPKRKQSTHKQKASKDEGAEKSKPMRTDEKPKQRNTNAEKPSTKSSNSKPSESSKPKKHHDTKPTTYDHNKKQVQPLKDGHHKRKESAKQPKEARRESKTLKDSESSRPPVKKSSSEQDPKHGYKPRNRSQEHGKERTPTKQPQNARPPKQKESHHKKNTVKEPKGREPSDAKHRKGSEVKVEKQSAKTDPSKAKQVADSKRHVADQEKSKPPSKQDTDVNRAKRHESGRKTSTDAPATGLAVSEHNLRHADDAMRSPSRIRRPIERTPKKQRPDAKPSKKPTTDDLRKKQDRPTRGNAPSDVELKSNIAQLQRDVNAEKKSTKITSSPTQNSSSVKSNKDVGDRGSQSSVKEDSDSPAPKRVSSNQMPSDEDLKESKSESRACGSSKSSDRVDAQADAKKNLSKPDKDCDEGDRSPLKASSSAVLDPAGGILRIGSGMKRERMDTDQSEAFDWLASHRSQVTSNPKRFAREMLTAVGGLLMTDGLRTAIFDSLHMTDRITEDDRESFACLDSTSMTVAQLIHLLQAESKGYSKA